jgi:hypothetical protein
LYTGSYPPLAISVVAWCLICRCVSILWCVSGSVFGAFFGSIPRQKWVRLYPREGVRSAWAKSGWLRREKGVRNFTHARGRLLLT